MENFTISFDNLHLCGTNGLVKRSYSDSEIGRYSDNIWMECLEFNLKEEVFFEKSVKYSVSENNLNEMEEFTIIKGLEIIT